MGDVMFVLKSFVVTVCLIFLMQIRIGSSTIEQHSLAWLQSSAMVDNLQAVAAGTIKAVAEGYRFVGSLFDKNDGKKERAPSASEGESEKDSTFMGLKIRRSEAYQRQKEREAKSRGETTSEDTDRMNDEETD